MINTSQLFSSKIAESTRQLSARLMYGTEEISGAIRSVQITSGACGEGNFTVGTVFSSYIEVVIDECKDALEDKELLLQIGLLIDDETVEYVDIGYYTVTKPKSSVYSTTFTAVGRITSKLNKLFDVPAVLTLKNIADAITAATGITIVFNGEVSNAVLAKDITGLTCKEALSVIAGTFGGFATEDNSGNIVVSKYNTDSKVPVNGDRMTALPEFNDYDYELNGIKVVASAASESEDGSAIEEVAFTEGEPRFAMTNEFMTADLFESFVTNTVGYIYRPGAVPLALGDPRLQPWDCLEVTDLNDNVHIVPCLNIVHTFDGGLTTTITAPGESESESSSSVAGPLAQQVEQIAYKLLIAQEAILKRLRANEILADNITGATGNFTKYLTGVKIIGDLIEAGTLKTDRLIIKGTDGKYYALSTDFSGLPNVEPVKEDAIHGSVLVKKSITADRINVTDLFAQTIEATGAIKGATIETNAGNIAGWDLQKDCLANENETILPTGWGMDIPVKVSGKLYSKPESFTFSEGASGGTDGFYPTGTTQHCIPLLEFDVTEAEYQSKTGVTLLGVVDDGNYATVLLNSNGASLKLSNTAELEAEGSSFRAGVNYASVYGAEGITLTGDVDVNGNLSICGVDIAEIIEAVGGGGGGSSEYETVDSVEEMTDTSKSYVLSSTGTIWAYGETEPKPAFTDLANNFEVGRFNSSGAVTTSNATGAYACLDFISFTKNTVVKIKGLGTLLDYNSCIYTSTATTTPYSVGKANAMSGVQYAYDSASDIVTLKTTLDNLRTLRVSGIPTTTIDDVIITVNEEIAYTPGYGWYDTEMTPSAAGGSGGGNYIDLLVKVNANTARIVNVENRLSEIESSGSGASSESVEIPSYWETMVTEKTETVKALQTAGGKDCVSFAWASDTHIPDYLNDYSTNIGVATYLGRVMAKMMDNCELPFAVLSGDINTRASYSTEEAFVTTQGKIAEHLAPLWGTDRLIMALGNHDGAYGDSTCSYRKQFPPERMWQIFFRSQALDFRRVFSDDGTYFYVDNIAQKTRFIVLNSHFAGEYSVDSNGLAVNNRFSTSCYGQTQLDWLADVALDLPEGYSAIITTHAPPNIDYTVDKAQLIGIINAYCNKSTYSGSYTGGVAGWTNSSVSVDFTSAKGEIIAVFAGHIHWDKIDVKTLACPLITIIAAGATVNEHQMEEGEVQPTRTRGTDTETSFDIVTINKKTRKIYCTRVGAGSDRVIDY